MKRYIAIMAVYITGEPDDDAAYRVAEYIAEDLSSRDFGGERHVRGRVDDFFWDEVDEDE